MARDTVRHRIDAIIRGAVVEGIQPGDDAVLRSLLGVATEDDIVAILNAFFDVELVTQYVYDQFVDRGGSWNEGVRRRLVEALFFCGLDAEADSVMATLT
jgi:hypothetical protein